MNIPRDPAQSQADFSPKNLMSRLWAGRTFGWLEAGFLLIVVVALVMRLWELGGRTVHYDEAIHLHFAWKLSPTPGAFLCPPSISGSKYIHTTPSHGPPPPPFPPLASSLLSSMGRPPRRSRSTFTASASALLYGRGQTRRRDRFTQIASALLYCRGLSPLCGASTFIASASALLYCRGL